jgi:hypothetical protein
MVPAVGRCVKKDTTYVANRTPNGVGLEKNYLVSAVVSVRHIRSRS